LHSLCPDREVSGQIWAAGDHLSGGILTGLGWMLASVVTSVEMLYLMYGVIGGIGVGIAYGAPVAIAADGSLIDVVSR